MLGSMAPEAPDGRGIKATARSREAGGGAAARLRGAWAGDREVGCYSARGGTEADPEGQDKGGKAKATSGPFPR